MAYESGNGLPQTASHQVYTRYREKKAADELHYVSASSRGRCCYVLFFFPHLFILFRFVPAAHHHQSRGKDIPYIIRAADCNEIVRFSTVSRLTENILNREGFFLVKRREPERKCLGDIRIVVIYFKPRANVLCRYKSLSSKAKWHSWFIHVARLRLSGLTFSSTFTLNWLDAFAWNAIPHY